MIQSSQIIITSTDGKIKAPEISQLKSVNDIASQSDFDYLSAKLKDIDESLENHQNSIDSNNNRIETNKHSISILQETIENNEKSITSLQEAVDNILNLVYPVGTIYYSETISTAEELQQKFNGFGEWERISQGKFIIGEGTGYDSNGVKRTFNINDKGVYGEYVHVLQLAEIPSHSHKIYRVYEWNNNTHTFYGGGSNLYSHNNDVYSGKSGDGKDHNNIPPYHTLYIFKRIA